MSRSLASVLVGTFTLRLSTGLTGALLIYYLASLHLFGGIRITAREVGLIQIFFFATELTLSPAFGMLCDRVGRKPVMQLGPLFGAAAVIITGLSVYIPALLGTRILEGASTAATVPAILGFVAASTSRDEGLRGRSVAGFEMATVGGLGAGSVLAGPLWDNLHQLSFFLNAGIYAMTLAIYTVGVKEVEASSIRLAGISLRMLDGAAQAISSGVAAAARRYGHLFTRSQVMILAPTWIALNAIISVFSFQTLFQLVGGGERRAFAADQLFMQGISPTHISIGLLAGFIVFIAGMLFWGNQFKRFRRTSMIFAGAGSAILGVIDAFVLNHSAGAPLVLFAAGGAIAIGVLFVLAGATPAALGLLADVSEAFPHDRGAIMGLYSVFIGIGQIVGAGLGGVAADIRGIDGLLGLVLVLIVIALVPLAALRRYEGQVGGSTPALVPHPLERSLD